MKRILMSALMIAAFSSATTLYAKPMQATKAPTKAAKRIESRSEKTRRQIAMDLHWRGSNIPPAFSHDGRWSR